MEDAVALPGRDEWKRPLEFILTLVGYAVGLGNVWRFPYLCYKNGGGAFLIPYTVCLLLLGIPMFALEVSFGQYGGQGITQNWKRINPALKGLGVASMCLSLVVVSYYGVVIGWGVYYLIVSMSPTLPWSYCSDCSCLLFAHRHLARLQVENVTDFQCLFYHGHTGPPAEFYFKHHVLRSGPSLSQLGVIQWELMMCNMLGWVLVFIALCKGIRSLSKVVYVTTTLPYLLLTIMLIHLLHLEGATEGIRFYITPNFSRLLEFEVWVDAAVQIFFSLSIGQGGLVALSSYNTFHNNVFRDSLLVPMINAGTSVFAGFVVFATLGHMAAIKNVDVGHVIKSGPGLVFIAYPDALSKMSMPTLWSVLFFSLFCLIGLSSQLSIAQSLMTTAADEFRGLYQQPKLMYACRLVICCLGCVLGLPFVTQGGEHILDLVDTAIIQLPTLTVCVCELVAIVFVYGYRNFSDDVQYMTGKRPLVFIPCWVVISPLLVVVMIVMTVRDYRSFRSRGMPGWVDTLAVFLVTLPLLWIPLWFLCYVWPRSTPLPKGVWQHIKDCNAARPEWHQRRSAALHRHRHPRQPLQRQLLQLLQPRRRQREPQSPPSQQPQELEFSDNLRVYKEYNDPVTPNSDSLTECCDPVTLDSVRTDVTDPQDYVCENIFTTQTSGHCVVCSYSSSV